MPSTCVQATSEKATRAARTGLNQEAQFILGSLAVWAEKCSLARTNSPVVSSPAYRIWSPWRNGDRQHAKPVESCAKPLLQVVGGVSLCATEALCDRGSVRQRLYATGALQYWVTAILGAAGPWAA